MNIIVIGAGRMGQSLAGRLIEEGHSVTVVDWDPNKIEHISTNYDVMALQGNGADYEVLTEAGAEDADLLLAVTSDDAVNMLCCLTARKLGGGNTVARVRTMEYFRQLVFFKEELGRSLVFNPEHDAAAEISRILRIPSAAKVESFAKGRAEMVEFTITAGMPICGMKLSQLGGRYGSGILISAVQRNSDVVIPTGSYTLEAGDVVHVVGAPAKMSAFFKAIGTHKRSVRDVMILGGGRISLYLGRELIDAGIRVKIIEEDEEHCETIKEISATGKILACSRKRASVRLTPLSPSPAVIRTTSSPPCLPRAAVLERS